MRVSLIVAVAQDQFPGRERNLFASIAAQTWPRDALELILVDPHASPETAADFAGLRARHPGLEATLLDGEGKGRAHCNNLAAARAGGDLLIFLADDFDPVPELVAAHAAYHVMNPDPRHAVGIGPGLFPEALRQDFFVRWAEDSGHLFGVPMRRVLANWPREYFYAGNASIKKAAFDALGGFDERFPHEAWDDYEFGVRWARDGGRSQLIVAAAALHRHRVTLAMRCVSLERAGASAHVLERLHPDLHHGWRALLRRGAQARLAEPAADAPAHVKIAYCTEQFAVAFRRGYLRAGAT